jgi:hypothetical protein
MRQFETANFAFCVKGAGLSLHIIIESKPLIIILFGVLIQFCFSWAALHCQALGVLPASQSPNRGSLLPL